MQLIKSSLAENFYEVIETSTEKRKIKITPNVKIYLVGVLMGFSTPNNPLQEYNQSLTFKLNESLNENNKSLKEEKLRTIGDLCLFLTGYFPDFIEKKGSGQMDYHIAIGSTAYRVAGECFTLEDNLFQEMSKKFSNLRLVIGDIRPKKLYDNYSINQLFERWTKTRETYEHNLLIYRGAVPVIGSDKLN